MKEPKLFCPVCGWEILMGEIHEHPEETIVSLEQRIKELQDGLKTSQERIWSLEANCALLEGYIQKLEAGLKVSTAPKVESLACSECYTKHGPHSASCSKYHLKQPTGSPLGEESK